MQSLSRPGQRPWIVVFTNFPSPYQVDLFNEASRRKDILLTVGYESSTSKHRLWESSAIAHSHLYLERAGASDISLLVERADLIVFSGYRSRKLRSLMIAREATGRPWVFWGERMGYQLPLWAGSFLRKWILSTLHRSRAGMWGIGSLAVNQFEKEFGGKRDYANIPYTSNLSSFLAIQRNDRADSKMPLRFLFSGSFIRRKGFDLLLRAFERLLDSGRDVQLVIIGNGKLEPDAAKLAARHEGHVELLGFVQPENLATVYGQCDVLCAPSRHDGWGLVVVEGLAAGMPVISTSGTGAAIDLIRSDCGWLIKPGDESELYAALKAATEVTPKERLAMGMAGRSRAADYDCKLGANRFIGAARSVLGQ